MEPTPSTARLLLGAVLSDTVILNSPTTTERDSAVVDYLERVLAIDATAFGRDMFEATSDVSSVDADDIVRRDAKEYALGEGRTICIAQIETGRAADPRSPRRAQEALERQRESRDYLLCALMVTDILGQEHQDAGRRAIPCRSSAPSGRSSRTACSTCPGS
jgi:manganese-dependent inorganic pyrophosphatase